MEYKSFQHVERLGTDETDGIEIGKCYIFPKLDGTNATAYLGDDGEIHTGSRHRELSIENDNQGFHAKFSVDPRLQSFFKEHPNLRLYGEYVKKHTIKTYRDDVWGNFYIFCVMDENGRYLPYDEYAPLLAAHELDYIPPLKIITNPTPEDLAQCVEQNTYLIKDGEGVGEGIVIHNYDFVNKYDRLVFAKIVRNEFKDAHRHSMGAPTKENRIVEEEIVAKYVTPSFVEKEFAKMIENEPWNSKRIPELLGRVWHTLIDEEAWNFIGGKSLPTINFKALNQLTIGKIKAVKPELF